MNHAARCARALAQIAHDQNLNAWCFVDQEGALAAARASDQRHANGTSRGALDGRLIALKANIAVQGWPWDAGLTRLRSRIAIEDAPIVTALRAAGAVLLGLTRMDEAALGASGMSVDGPIRLASRPSDSPGGSSGGAAVAIAAHHCDLAIGTDTLGSVRIPAALCGVAGFRPQAHSLSIAGIEPLHPDYDQPGPIARSLECLIAGWQAMTYSHGPSAALTDESLTKHEAPTWQALALPTAILDSLQPDVMTAYRQTIDRLRASPIRLAQLDQKADIEDLRCHIATLGAARRALFTLCEKTLAQRWHITPSPVAELPTESPVGEFSLPLGQMLTYGANLSATKVASLQETLQRFTQSWSSLNERLSARYARPIIWLLPTTPVLAFRHAEGPPKDLADWTSLASATGWAAVTLPRQGGDTIGLQLVSANLDNDALLRAAQEMTRNLLSGRNPDSLSPTDMQ